MIDVINVVEQPRSGNATSLSVLLDQNGGLHPEQ